MAKEIKLGKGLDILLAHSKKENVLGDKFATLSVDKLQRGEFQPRRKINDEAFKELTESIKYQGIIQPLIVRQIGDKYEIIAGERRWRSAQLVSLSKVPVIIRKINNEVALAIGLIENIQREALSPLEEASALVKLIDDFGITHHKASVVVGRSRSAVSNIIRLLQLNYGVKQMLNDKKIEAGHARALLPLDDEQQFIIANKVVSKKLSVRQIERLVKQIISPKISNNQKIPQHIIDLTDTLSKNLDLNISIKMNGKNGKFTIKFNSKEELQKIIKLCEKG